MNDSDLSERVNNSSDTEKAPDPPSSGVIPLENTWTFWFDEKIPKGTPQQAYQNNINKIGSFSTVQDFWRYWNNILIYNLPDYSNLRLFKDGIKPSWEDPANCEGGKWVFYSSKEEANKMWSHLVLALIGEQFEYGDELCGTVLSIRPKQNTINLWNKRANDKHQIESTSRTLRRLLNLSETEPLTYQIHSGTVAFNDKYIMKLARQKQIRNKKLKKNSPASQSSSALLNHNVQKSLRGHQRCKSIDDNRSTPDLRLMRRVPSDPAFRPGESSPPTHLSNGLAHYHPPPSPPTQEEGTGAYNVNFFRGHKKSSSFSSSPYDNNWRRHKKTPSDSYQTSTTLEYPETSETDSAEASPRGHNGNSSNAGQARMISRPPLPPTSSQPKQNININGAGTNVKSLGLLMNTPSHRRSPSDSSNSPRSCPPPPLYPVTPSPSGCSKKSPTTVVFNGNGRDENAFPKRSLSNQNLNGTSVPTPTVVAPWCPIVVASEGKSDTNSPPIIINKSIECPAQATTPSTTITSAKLEPQWVIYSMILFLLLCFVYYVPSTIFWLS